MAKVCSLCNKEYKGAACPVCTETGVDVKKVLESEKAQMEKNDSAPPTAFLVDLVSNRKIPITTPRCRVGRDDLNDIVISGDQSISRFHFIITYENGQYQTQDAKSRHGTFLNGNQIGGPEPINDGDVLKIGVSLFWFVIESAAGAEKEEPLPPVDVEKATGTEDISMKTGGDYNYSAEKELSATQEISIISPEALAQYSLTKKAEDEAFEPKEPTEEVSAESKKEDDAKSDSADEKNAAEATESKKEDEAEKPESDKDDDAKAEPEQDKEEEAATAEDKPEEKPEAKSEEKSEEKSEDTSDDKSDEKSEDKSEDKKAEEPVAAEDSQPENKESDEEKNDAKEDDKSVQVDFEPTSEDDAESKKKDDIEIAVKDLLEPLQSEIEASREMVRDALRKGELKSEPEEEKQDSKDADEKEEEPTSSSEEEQSEDSDKDSEKDDNKEEQPESKSDDDEKPEETKKDNEKSAEAETLEKIAEIIDDSSKSDLSDKRDDGPSVSADRIETELASDHDKATNGLDEDMTTVSQIGPTNVPDWCKRYFSDELKHLNKELDTLNDQIKAYQDKIRKIEGQAALTKGIRNTLLTSDGDDLIEACKKVLGLAGWKVTQSEEDKHEFLLEHEDEKVAIARVISIKGAAERSHLGQLTISQTRFWCEKGIEPKGVLIVGRVSDKSPKERGEDTNEEVLEYANMKNVCIMNTLQLLALYRDIALKDGKTGELRSSIHDSKGWLKGFDIEPGDDIIDEDGEGSKSKSLSSLLSA